jgi:valyl-tRNA synthetase
VIRGRILVDREFGTGIVKVTPAHDVNDFASGSGTDLPSVVVIGPDGKMTAEAGELRGPRPLRGAKGGRSRASTAENRLVGASRTR